MYNSFYRKVGFGIGINDKIPADPLKWATDQLDKIPELCGLDGYRLRKK